MGKHSSPGSTPHHQPQRHPQRDQSGAHRDPYDTGAKAPGIQVCETCSLVHHDGRWFAGAPPLGDVTSAICPACRRVRERRPAGTLELRAFPHVLLEELKGIVRHAEERERAEHPLERLMDVEERRDGLRVTTTGPHLARCIGEALARRFRGEVAFSYEEGAGELRVDAVHRSS